MEHLARHRSRVRIRREAQRFYYRDKTGKAYVAVLVNKDYSRAGKPREPGDKAKWINQLWIGDKGGNPVSLLKLDKGVPVAWNLPPESAFTEYPYRMEKFTPGRKTLIVEGEAAADEAAALLSDWNVLTWRGGSQRGKKGKTAGIWDVLKGQEVYCWPDQDSEGRKL